MSSPPIDDGTPMNVSSNGARSSEVNGARSSSSSASSSSDSHHHISHAASASTTAASPPQVPDDDNPDNNYRAVETRRRPDLSSSPHVASSAAAPSLPPASPLQGADVDAEAADVNGVDVDARLDAGDDRPDALPRLFRAVAPAGAAASVAPSGDAAEPGKAIKGSVEAWSATDVYALPPTFPSMGQFVIISNKNFDARTGMGDRNGTDVDAQELYLRFKEFGFDVKVKRNMKAKEIKDLFQEIGKADHSSCAAFGCAILSHGDDGVIYGTDRQIEIDQLTRPFKGDMCKSLVGKPKLFFIQACRGSDLMDGVGVTPYQVDANQDIAERLPVESDVLMAYSVVPGYFSWRNSIRGSWFIQALCQCLDKYGKSMDILRLLTRVNKQVALNFESNTNNKDMHKKKQIPCITSMLTKDFYLDPKALIDLDGSP